ncbi:DUF5719 family protein [Litorihabitans aurantiacus]|uniref:Large extracellular alpha-helical protein n=1 Tax=Litorihabitans aurantiacus TaxID=1930061 RepID=A0AA37UHA4_9MICO|nr:DUF5719 family protein [Litorihabitans aurantiacus]GMA30633.1 hypothetical protein GCM10025875_06250 [Litorihabitans aurantiacus]
MATDSDHDAPAPAAPAGKRDKAEKRDKAGKRQKDRGAGSRGSTARAGTATPAGERGTAAGRGPENRTSAPSRGRTTWRRVGATLSGALVLALAGGVAVGGGLLERPRAASSDPLVVAVPPTQVALACPGPGEAPDGGATDSELGGASVTTADVRALVLPRGDEEPRAVLGPLAEGGGETLTGTGDAVVATLAQPEGSSVLRAEPSASAAAFAAAAGASRADTGDLRGLAAASCPPGATSSWLVGGTTELGASAVLALRNVGSTPATVSLRAWDAVGEVAVGGTSILVPPGQEVRQALEASVPDAERLAVLVTATGGQVSATVQTSQLTGLTPAGTDVVAPTAMPALEQLVPGVVLTTTTVDESDPSLVRILNPGDEPTTVRLELLGSDGTTALTDDAGLVVEAGAVADVSLAGAPAGTFTVRAVADDPVVAAAMLVRRGEPAPEDPDVPVMDRAWLPALPPVTSAALALPGVGSLVDRGVLVIGNGEADTAEVMVTALNGGGEVLGTQEVTVPGSGSAALEVTSLGSGVSGVVLESDVPVSSAAVLTFADVLGELIAVVGAQADPQVERSAAVTISGS